MARPEPFFTIVTVNLNNAAELKKTVASVVGQTFDSLEYIIVDGGSTDNSLSVVKAYEASVDQFVSEADGGIYDAMNKGVKLAHGEWILFLNSGDALAANNVLEKIVAQMQSSEADILLGAARIRYPDGTSRLQTADAPVELPYGMICSHQAIFARRKWLAAMPFTVARMRSDYEFLLRAWRRGLHFKASDLVVAEVAAGGWSDRDRFSSLRERWSLLRQEGAFSLRLLPHFGFILFLAILSPTIKLLLPPRAISSIRALKIRYLGLRSSRG